MSWRDRDYRLDDVDGGAAPWRQIRRPPRVTLVIMVLHGLAFALMLVLQEEHGAAVTAVATLGDGVSHPLGILTHPFATTSLFSVLFGTLALWSLGGRIERIAGPACFIALYVAGNLVAGAAYFGVARARPPLATAPLDYPAGALAALCLSAWHRLRDDPVQIFGRVTSFGRVYAICGAIVIGLTLLTGRAGALAWTAAALSSVATGGAVELLGNAAQPWRAHRFRAVRRKTIPQTMDDDAPDIDDILAKISRAGVDSLSPAERRKLEAARHALLRRGD